MTASFQDDVNNDWQAQELTAEAVPRLQVIYIEVVQRDEL
jgi:hypothetical protein